MRIGVETHSLSGEIGGIPTYTRTLLEALRDQDVLCYQSRNFPPTCHKHHFFRRCPKLPFIHSLAALTHHRCFDKVNLVHFPQPRILFGIKPKVPYILTIHDVMPLLLPHFFPKKDTALMRYFLPYYLHHAKAIIAVSNSTKEDLLKLFPLPEKKIEVIPCMLPRSFYQREKKPCPSSPTTSKKTTPFILYVGSREPRKNLMGIFSAFKQLKKWGIPHQLVLITKKEEEECLPQDAACTGPISEEKKRTLLQTASLLILPSFYEGFGIPLIEAMGSGTPILTSNLGAMKEIAGKAALFVNPHHPEEMAEKMRALLGNPHLQKQLIEEGFNQVQPFLLENVTPKILDLYKRVASSTQST